MHIYDWLQLLENGNEVCCVFFDLKKAFNIVPYSLLLQKLSEIEVDPYWHCPMDLQLPHLQIPACGCWWRAILCAAGNPWCPTRLSFWAFLFFVFINEVVFRFHRKVYVTLCR